MLSMCPYCVRNQDEDGLITRGTIIEASHSTPFPDMTRNFHGFLLKASGPTKYVALYDILKVNETHFKNKRGYTATAFEEFQSRMNFTYEVSPCGYKTGYVEGGTGNLFPNGTWTGCIGKTFLSKYSILIMILYILFRGHLQLSCRHNPIRRPI